MSMRVRILQRLEDANRFEGGEADALTTRQEFTIGHRVTASGAVIRVDKFRQGAEVALPDQQARKLIGLGLAELC